MADNDSYIGPNYSYHSKIKSPDKLGISPTGGIGNNISGMFSYLGVLITGESDATNYIDTKLNGVNRSGPLGPKFFIKTGGKCINEQDEQVDRSSYINNVPDGKIPLVSSMLGDQQFSSFKGLLPGILTNISHLNPLNLLNVFSNSSDCKQVRLETIDENDVVKYENRFLLTSEIANIDPCWFPCDSSGNRTNPDYVKENKVCSEKCTTTEGFINNIDMTNTIDKSKLPDNFLIQLYFFSLTLLMIYFIMKMGQRK